MNEIHLGIIGCGDVTDYRNPSLDDASLIEVVVADLLGKGKGPSTGISAARASWILEELCGSFYDYRRY